MKKILFKCALATFAFPVPCWSLIAQKSVSDLAELSDKKWNKFVTAYNNHYWLEGPVNTDLLDADKTPQPKRIGILTVQLYSLGTVATSGAGDWLTTTTYSSSVEGQAYFVDQMLCFILIQIIIND